MKRLFLRSLMRWLLSCSCLLLPSVALGSDHLQVASFNIQVFGLSKVNKPFVKQSLLSILSRYDLSFIQEIRDNDNAAIYQLVAELNARSGRNYQVVVSERLGRGEMKEQYAYIYDPAKVQLVDSYVFEDARDDFEREPFIAHFEAGNQVFTMAGLHTTPTAVGKELKALGAVHRGIQERFASRNVFIVGDLNADCTYYKPAALGFSYFDEPVAVLVSDDVDTTVGATHCAYDRVLGFGPILAKTSRPQVFNYQEAFGFDMAAAKLISDHFPIEFSLAVGTFAEPSSAEPLPPLGSEQEAPLATCGRDPYLSKGGYCMASFGKSVRRVMSSCCP